MKKIVINACYGGFGLSPRAAVWMFEKGFREEGFATPCEKYFQTFGGTFDEEGLRKAKDEWDEFIASGKSDKIFLTVFSPCGEFVLNDRDIPRDHPLLIECVETLKKDADGWASKLKIVEVPDDVKWHIGEYDGLESVDEDHRSWS